MLAPISSPLGAYPVGELNLTDVPLWPGMEPIEEPKLRTNNYPWAGRANTTANNPCPSSLFGHERLGGQITICVLCYGSNHALHARCLSSIRRSTPAAQVDLRVALNCVCPETAAYVKHMAPTKIYTYSHNHFKYPIMRDMLWDEEQPIVTPYLVWFDDDAYASHNNWLNLLATTIVQQPDSVGMYGIPAYHRLETSHGDPRRWFQDAPWFTGKHFRNSKGIAVPNGDTVHFCAGWFWAMRTAIIKQCDIPCRRLQQVGGEIAIGEQLHQHGLLSKCFNIGKSVVYTEPSGSKKKRGPTGLLLPWYTYTGS